MITNCSRNMYCSQPSLKMGFKTDDVVQTLFVAQVWYKTNKQISSREAASWQEI